MLTIATINLYHYAAPPVWWYRVDREDPPRHSEASWAAKRVWLQRLLRTLDADAVGFQEVVAVEDLAALCREAGYPYFFAAGEPRIEIVEGEQVYTRPVQAVASRVPMAAEALRAPEGFAARAGMWAGWDFRRPPVAARLETRFGEVVLICAHLKSGGVSVDEGAWAARLSAGMTASERSREIAEARARGHLASVRQRAAEAAALQQAAFAAMAERSERPVVLVGDFNAEPGSPTLGAALSADWVGDPDEAAPEALEAARFWRFIDAARLAPPMQLSAPRTPTHAAGIVLDYVLVSSHFDGSPAARGRVVEHCVTDVYLRDGSRAAETSDHAAVRVRFGALG